MHQKRLRGYKKLDYKVKSDFELDSDVGILFDENNYFDALVKDMDKASKEIVISSPFITRNSVYKMIDVLSNAIGKGVSVLIYTRPADEYNEKRTSMVSKLHEEIKSAEINIIFANNLIQKFALIDKSVVWFGSINILANNQDESMMRICDKEIASELVESI